MPAFDFSNTMDLLPGIIRAISMEINACAYYMALMETAPGNTEKELISRMIEENILGCNLYRDVYEKLAGCPPVILTPESPEIENFEKGISNAFMDETRAYRLYRDLSNRNPDEFIRRILLSSMSDKEQHAMRLLFMGAYSGSREEQEVER